MSGRTAAACTLFASVAIAAAGSVDPRPDWKSALPGINPDMLSGGVYASIAAAIAPAPRVERAPLVLAASSNPIFLDPRVGANVPVGSDPIELPAGARQQAEPHVVRSATDPDFLVATFQEGRFASDGGARNCGYGVTRDGGLTWRRALIPGLTTVSGGPYFRATDPVAGIDRSGNIFLNTLVSLDNAFGLGAVVINKSTDGGTTFGAPVTVFQPPNTLTFPDKNWMAVNDYPGTFSTGRVLVSWTNFARNSQGQSTSNNIVSRTSDDSGATWDAIANVTPLGGSKQGSQPMFFADGTAGMAYITFLDSNNVLNFRIQYQHSQDGGRTWPGPERTVAPVSGWDDPVLRDGAFLISATSARTSGRIVIAATATIVGQPRIVFFGSTDRGVTWTGPIIASDNSDAISVVNPAVAVSADGLEVSIIYYEKAEAIDPLNFVNIKAVHSFDGGTTWSPSVLVTDVATDVRLGQSTDRGYMLGDYQGLSMPAGSDAPPVALWIDTRTGNADPFSARVTPSQTANFAAWRRSHFPSASLANPATVAVDADPDADGLPNGIEYAFATDPVRADFATPFGYKRAAGPEGPELILSHPRHTLLPDAQLEWDRSTDGVTWTPVASRTEAREWIRGGSAALFTTTHPLAGDPAARFRLRATVGGTPAPAARSFASSSDARLVNVSTRGNAGVGNNILIGGFYLAGSPLKEVLVRGAGPSLAPLGVAGPLGDPRLDLFRAGAVTPFTSNDDWDSASLTATAAKVGAFAWTAGSKDSALLISPGSGGVTAQVKGAAGGTGVALVEIYDANPEITTGHLTNLSTRGHVGTGEQILIAGFYVAGTEPKLVLVRAVGPTLADYGVPSPLSDPRLEIFRAGEQVPIAQIDDWGHAVNPRAANDAALLSGAFALPAESLDASILLQLPSGGYTAHVIGVNGSTGIALVEVYEVN